MKKFVILLCLLLLLCGCTVSDADPTVIADADSLIVPEQTQPKMILSHELAMLEGYVVLDEGDVRHNAGNWLHFLKECEAGNTAAVTVVSFTLEESGYKYVRYDLSYNGNTYTVEYEKNGEVVCDSASELVYSTGKLEPSMEPYDSYECYCLNDLVIYNDLIAEPDFEGVNEIFLHDKEGEPAIKSYSGDAMQPILELLWTAEYVSCDPEQYVYGMKLLMTNRDGKELVIELDLNQGYYRYGMQTYRYGEISTLFAALGIEQWPDSVLNEFGDYLG